MFFHRLPAGDQIGSDQKDAQRLARFCALGSTANRRVQPVWLKRATYALQTLAELIAPENSLPQLGQVRWGSALIFLTTPPRPQPKAAPRSAERCELGQHRIKSRFRTKFLSLESRGIDGCAKLSGHVPI
jgi:hypothetical protein